MSHERRCARIGTVSWIRERIQVRHDMLCQRDTEVDEFREAIVQILKVRYETGLQSRRACRRSSIRFISSCIESEITISRVNWKHTSVGSFRSYTGPEPSPEERIKSSWGRSRPYPKPRLVKEETASIKTRTRHCCDLDLPLRFIAALIEVLTSPSDAANASRT